MLASESIRKQAILALHKSCKHSADVLRPSRALTREPLRPSTNSVQLFGPVPAHNHLRRHKEGTQSYRRTWQPGLLHEALDRLAENSEGPLKAGSLAAGFARIQLNAKRSCAAAGIGTLADPRSTIRNRFLRPCRVEESSPWREGRASSGLRVFRRLTGARAMGIHFALAL